MGLFSLFKKKAEQESTIVPSDGVKALADGILFESDGVFIKWGADPEADKNYIKKEFRADRVIYQWGDKTILGGLRLPFKTVCWHHKQHGDARSLESLEYSTEGDDAATKFESIKKHVEYHFGDPKQHENLQPGEISLEWKVKAIKISLQLFKKDNPKVHLEIGWWV